MTAFIIGNGQSRRDIDLTKLNGMTYGCNALYKEFIPDVLVATDDPISRQIQSSGYAKTHRFYTRTLYSGTGALKLRLPYSRWSSGSNALQLAVHDNHNKIILIGFDFGGSTLKLNNLYANTEFYQNSVDHVRYYGNWMSECNTIIKSAEHVQFTIVIGKDTSKSVSRLLTLPNVKIDSIDEFINNVMETII